jgi:multisubunit Na+/H+ antiporter MnhE subunit
MPRSIRRAIAAFLVAAAFYLLLIDSVDTPELIVAGVAAALATTGFELAREEGIVGEALRLRWFARAHRPLLRVPGDIVTLALVAARQIASPQPARGEFSTAPFRARGDEAHDTGRRALAEALGSFAPNTIVVGVDGDRELILAHQLRRSGPIDPLELG